MNTSDLFKKDKIKRKTKVDLFSNKFSLFSNKKRSSLSNRNKYNNKENVSKRQSESISKRKRVIEVNKKQLFNLFNRQKDKKSIGSFLQLVTSPKALNEEEDYFDVMPKHKRLSIDSRKTIESFFSSKQK